MTIDELRVQFDLNIKRKRSFLRKHSYKTDDGYFFIDSHDNQQHLLDVNCIEKDQSTVKSIGKGFEHSGITSFVIPCNVTKIDDNAFRFCRRLTSIALGDKVTSIGDESFYYCDRLPSIMLPKSLKCIGAFAFYACEKLLSITIPSEVKRIHKYAFECCGLTSMVFEDRTLSQVASMLDYPWGIRDTSIIQCSADTNIS